MKRALVALAGGLVLFVGVDWLGDLTQNRPDKVARGSRSEIVLDVSARGRAGPPLDATQGLWGACQGTVSHHLDGHVEPLGDGRFRLKTRPQLGRNSWRRLKGCLEDFTLDHVRAKVVTKADFPPEPPVATGG